MPFFSDDWMTRNDARGTGEEVREAAGRYNEASNHMAQARDGLERARSAQDESWQGQSGYEFRSQTDGLPALMIRSESSTRSVGAALGAFAPKLDDYNTSRARIQSDAHDTNRRLQAKELQWKEDSKGVWGDDWWEIGGSVPPELETLRNEMRSLEAELDRLRAQFEAEEESFEDAVKLAVRIIDGADDVLYDGPFQQWWDQHGEKILEVVRTILKVAAVVAAIATLILSGGTAAPLAAFIIAGALLATSVLKVAGTAAAHGWENVTTDMWLDVAADSLGVLTAGLGYKVALAGGDKAPQALRLFAGRAEKAEALFTMGGSVGKFADGDYIGGTLGVLGAGLELGGFKGLDNLYSGEAIKIAGGVAGSWEGIENLSGGAGYDTANEKIGIGLEITGDFIIEGAEHFGEAYSDNPPPVIMEAETATTADSVPADWPGVDEGGAK